MVEFLTDYFSQRYGLEADDNWVDPMSIDGSCDKWSDEATCCSKSGLPKCVGIGYSASDVCEVVVQSME